MKTAMLRAATALLAFAAVAPAADTPRPAPELVIKLANGQEQLLSKYRGKVVALEFLLTTCPHCQRASQTMNKLHREFGAQGFQPVGVAINDMANMLVADYVKQFNLTYPVGFTHRDTATQFLMHPVMMSMMMPQLVIIDRKGVIRYQYAGNDKFFENEEKNLRDLLVPMLKGDAAPTSSAPKKTSAAVSKAQ